VLSVFNIVSEDGQTINLCGEGGRNGGDMAIAAFGDLSCCPSGIGRRHGLNSMIPQEFPALPQRHDMAVGGFNLFQDASRRRHELEPDGHHMFRNDVQPRCREQMMDVSNPSRDRVFDGNHGQIGVAAFDGSNDILKGTAGHRCMVWIHIKARDVGIRTTFTLIGNGRLGISHLTSLWPFGAPFRR
jgi:hypothetical protein